MKRLIEQIPGFSYIPRKSIKKLHTTPFSDKMAALKMPDYISDNEITDVLQPIAGFLYQQYAFYREHRGRLALNSTKSLSPAPFLIAVSGSVAVGKSTFASAIKALLSRMPSHPKTDLLVTDGFLYANAVLTKKGILEKKGFPESYDTAALLQFIQSIKSGEAVVSVPVYSHEIYDVIPDKFQEIAQPDILVLEGINVLQQGHPDTVSSQLMVADYVDAAIYIDAAVEDVRRWFLERFMVFLEAARNDSSSFYHQFLKMSAQEAEDFALMVWRQINEENLVKHIAPTRERADIIVRKGADHRVEGVWLKR